MTRIAREASLPQITPSTEGNPMITNESYSYKPLAASASVIGSNGGVLGGFFCTTAGTLQLNENTGGGASVVPSFAVAVGIFYTLPFAFPPGVGCFATLGGGAAGTFAVA